MYYYLDNDNKPAGPLAIGLLNKLFEEGKITAETKVAAVDSSSWVAYREIMLPPVPMSVGGTGPAGRKESVNLPAWLPKFRAVPFVALLLTMALPFFEVSCQGQKVASISGYQSATGLVLHDPTGLRDDQRTPSSPLMITIITLGLLSVVFATLREKRLVVLASACGAAGTSLLIYFGLSSVEKANSQGAGLVTASLGLGFYLSTACFIAGALFNWLSRHALRAGGRTQPATPSAGGQAERQGDIPALENLPIKLPTVSLPGITWRPRKKHTGWMIAALALVISLVYAQTIYDALFNRAPKSTDVAKQTQEFVDKFLADRPGLTVVCVSTKEISRAAGSVRYEFTAKLEASEPLYAQTGRPRNFIPPDMQTALGKAEKINRGLPDDLKVILPVTVVPDFVQVTAPGGQRADFNAIFTATRYNHHWSFDRAVLGPAGTSSPALFGTPLSKFGQVVVIDSPQAAEFVQKTQAAYSKYIAMVLNAQQALDARAAKAKQEEEQMRADKLKIFAEGSSFHGVVREGDTRIDEVYLVITSNRFDGNSVTATLFHGIYPDRQRHLKGRVELDAQTQVPVAFLESLSAELPQDHRFDTSAYIFRGRAITVHAVATGSKLRGTAFDLVFELERMPGTYSPSLAPEQRGLGTAAAESAPGDLLPQYGGVMLRTKTGDTLEMFRAGHFPPGGTIITMEQLQDSVGQLRDDINRPKGQVWLTGTFAVTGISGRTLRATNFHPAGSLLGISALLKPQINYVIEFPQGVPTKFHPNQYIPVDSSQPLEVVCITMSREGKVEVNARVRVIDP